jgi:hypothetical protein
MVSGNGLPLSISAMEGVGGSRRRGGSAYPHGIGGLESEGKDMRVDGITSMAARAIGRNKSESGE